MPIFRGYTTGSIQFYGGIPIKMLDCDIYCAISRGLPRCPVE